MTTSEQTRRGVQRLMRNSVFSAKNSTRIGTWNVRTLYQSGRLAQLLREFDAHNLDILGISEVRWLGSGRITSDGKTVIYSCNDDQHERGVGLVLGKRADDALMGWKPVNDRIITARFRSAHTRTTVVQAYAPTEAATDAEKDAFYDCLQEVFNEIPNHDLKLLIGDFNGLLGDDRRGYEHVIGPFASAEATSENGERLRQFCNINGLCIGNTSFQHKQIHKKTWRAPGGRFYNEIDYVCINRRWRSALRDVRVYRSADVGSDHFLLRSQVKLKLKPQRRPIPVRPFAVEKLRDRHQESAYVISLQNRFQALEQMDDVEDKWTSFRQVMTEGAQETIGRRRGKRKEQWISDATWTLIDQRKETKKLRDQARTEEQNETAARRYAELDRQVKRSCRVDKKAWLEKKCNEAQEAANLNDAKTLYRIVRELTGIRSSPNIPIKNKEGKMLLTKEEQNARWIEHFQETLNQPNPPALYDFESEPHQPLLDVNMDDITQIEVNRAIKGLKRNKAAGMDEVSPELLKHGGRVVTQKLVELCNSCWQSETVPDDWRKGLIVKLPKKGNPTDCGNWRGITLLSVPGKVFCSVLLRRLKAAVELRLRENQAGFRQGRSCIEQIFTLRNVIEQCVKYKRPLCINFVDFKKAFDSVHRDTLWRILRVYGIPPRYVSIFKNLYLNSSCAVKTETGNTDFFQILTGVRQGCILSPFLFLLAVDFVMTKAMSRPSFGISWIDAARLTDLDFADDIALLAEERKILQKMTTALGEHASKVGLRISEEKTNVMQDCNTPLPALVPITIGQQLLTNVNRFTYLGSMLQNDGDSEADVTSRIGKAAAVFQRLRPIWSSTSINVAIKLRLYSTIVIPTAIYGSETWKTSVAVTRKVDVFHQRCLRSILRISYLDHITNVEVLRRSEMRKLSTIIAERRLRFAGHVLRMEPHRNPKIALMWKPTDARLGRGRPRTNWRSTFINDLK